VTLRFAFSSFYRLGKWDLERACNLSCIVQSISGRAGFTHDFTTVLGWAGQTSRIQINVTQEQEQPEPRLQRYEMGTHLVNSRIKGSNSLKGWEGDEGGTHFWGMMEFMWKRVWGWKWTALIPDQDGWKESDGSERKNNQAELQAWNISPEVVGIVDGQ
jgi:hypothetical protein